MKHLTINGSKRTIGRKADVRATRKEGKVPCVVYGNGVENTPFAVDEKELKTLTNTPYCHIVDLDIEGKKCTSLLGEVQYHPVTDRALHADFLAVDAKKPVVVEVPVIITGNSVGVKAGGKLQVSRRKLRISGLLENLPDDLTVDVTPLAIGKRITAGDLKFDNITIVNPKATIIVSCLSTRNAVAATETESTEAAAE
ncbi:MAG: 50S ribosomal protein L25 [Bacteroidales bacterium]|nr:50S ribosomal protein L25 [Bacteroidales bacterium]